MNPLMHLFSHLFAANAGAKVVSVVVAIVLWIVVLGSRAVEVTKEIPIEVTTPANLVVSNDIPDKVVFRLSGPKAFLRAILDRREDPIRVNLSGARAGVVTYRFFADNIHLPIGVRVLQVNPSSMIVKLEPQRSKEVPIRLDTSFPPPSGYALKRAELTPKMAKIRGPESRIEAIREVSTLPVDLSEVRSSLEIEAPLDLTRLGVQLESAPPRLNAEVAAVQANYRIRVRSTDVRVESSHKARVDDTLIVVYVRIEQGELQKLDSSQVSIGVDLTGKPKGRYTSKLRVSLPPNVGMVRVVPESVRVTLY